VDFVGNLCTSADSLGRKVTAPILEEGDLIVIPNSGAYCQTTALWGFNSQSLFFEAMLTRDGRLGYLEPQYSVLLNSPHGSH
jgi:diaminopimelate decarboxylase